MKTPICDFVDRYAADNMLRLHMPGHKGYNILGVESKDITEIGGADVLYSPKGIIAESEENARSLFGSGKTLYSTEGSSLCIRAMVYLVSLYAKRAEKKPLILAGRNAHKTFMSATALLDVDVEWIFPKGNGSIISCPIDAEMLERRFLELPEIPTAVYITSPDYLGNLTDIGELSAICKRYGSLLIVDNAHGAYLRFLPESLHPIDGGADMCCDSAHKTLPVLTGGAYLHISKNADSIFSEMANQAMSLFASTSPSYLIMQSLDIANRYMSEGYRDKLSELSLNISDLKIRLKNIGFSFVGQEPLKLTLATKAYGYYGFEVEKHLEGRGIVCEFADPDYIVMMFTPELDKSAFEKIYGALSGLRRREEICENPAAPGMPERVISIREAMMSPSFEIDTQSAQGYVLASANLSCPPAIPILVCGEKIDKEAIKCFEYYGINKCRVVK